MEIRKRLQQASWEQEVIQGKYVAVHILLNVHRNRRVGLATFIVL